MLYISNHLFLQLNDLLKGSLWWLNEITSSRLFKSGKLFHNAIHSFIFTYRELFSYKERFLMQSYLWPCFRKNFYSWKRPVAPNSSVSSVAQSYPTLCNPVVCRMPSFPVHHQLLKLAQTHVHWVSDAISSSHPLWPLLLLTSVFPSIRVFSIESVFHIRWPKYWSLSLSFSISPSKEYSGLISFRIDWFDLLSVQGTLKSLLQHHSSKASTLQLSAFFMVQRLLSYMTTRKTIALTRRT